MAKIIIIAIVFAPITTTSSTIVESAPLHKSFHSIVKDPYEARIAS